MGFLNPTPGSRYRLTVQKHCIVHKLRYWQFCHTFETESNSRAILLLSLYCKEV